MSGVNTTANGTAVFSYTGTDNVLAQVTINNVAATSNLAHISWVKPVAVLSTSAVPARFFTNNGSLVFAKTPSDTPVFTQTFPTLNFNPYHGSVPGAPAGLDENHRPFINVTSDVNGNYTGVIVAQGNGYVVGKGQLTGFQMLLTGQFVVAQAGSLNLTIYSDDGFSWGVGPDSNGKQPQGNINAGGNTPFFGYPILNRSGSYGSFPISINFPEPGVYPYEIDFAENGDGGLSFSVLSANNSQGVPASNSLAISPNNYNPALALTTGQSQSIR